MSTYSLISIDHINQLIPALAALRHFNARRNVLGKHILIFTKPHLHFSATTIAHLNTLLQKETSYTLILGSTLFKNTKVINNIPVIFRAKFLYKKLKNYPLTEIFFSHDISSDFWNQTLMHAFPKATRVCYGDALGLVYSHHHFTQLMYRLKQSNKIILTNILARLKRKFFYPSKKKQLLAHQAILTIPCDPGNDFLTQCELSIISQQELRDCVKNLADALPDFKTHLKELTLQSAVPCFLLMPSNFTESKLTTLENEIALYQEILNTHTPKGSQIIIKPHPAHNPIFLQAIIEVLKKNYEIYLVDNQYHHLPIELAESLIQGCEVLSVSYSSISIPYIYNKPVKHVLTQEMIDKYFSREKKYWFTESNNLYLRMITALQDWDQKNVLSI
ncbi:polysialyltransferase family glycosyltransferase [Legionella clemsonensis]|uniref:Uncharacterized protein n=1 Tax=Legionella clemsonensis TaxID=1867846 RepID=A0A222P3K8_9GAMM|nr:polysialyltransferase family glycosyltransferase [Legionella clemsonensis]ASQ46412.1 hypothetical protein clem_09310 [Legionella clemsonensis]